jgi:hypothetical protein
MVSTLIVMNGGGARRLEGLFWGDFVVLIQRFANLTR